MKLTKKAKEDFKNWYRNRLSVMTYSELLNINDVTVYSSLIIEWLDVVNLQITVEAIQGGDFRAYVLKDKFNAIWIDDRFDSRQKAMDAIILKANEIYNGK
jgi:hypothetical protein